MVIVHWPHFFVGRPCGMTKDGKWNTVPHRLQLTPEMEVLIAGEGGGTKINRLNCELL